MFEHWDSFFLLIGGAAGALIGLMFVVVTLTARLDLEQAERGATVYMTPIILHFASVLVLSAVGSVQQAAPAVLAGVFGLVGVLGFGASLRVAILLRTGRLMQAAHWTDFWWYGFGPTAAYLGLVAAAVAIVAAPAWGAPLVGAALVAVLLLGVRNAWDLVTWMAPRADSAEKLTSPETH
jgi:hypothetical protein